MPAHWPKRTSSGGGANSNGATADGSPDEVGRGLCGVTTAPDGELPGVVVDPPVGGAVSVGLGAVVCVAPWVAGVVGVVVGGLVGTGVGLGVGTGVGLGVGTGVGFGVGLGVGLGVGFGVGLAGQQR